MASMLSAINDRVIDELLEIESQTRPSFSSAIYQAPLFANSVADQQKLGFLAEMPQAWCLKTTQPGTWCRFHLCVQGKGAWVLTSS